MKNLPRKTTALFLSLLVFPGAGQIYWGEKKKGYLLILFVILDLAVLFILFEKELVHQINSFGNPLLAISHSWELIKKTCEVQWKPLIAGSVILLVLWIGSGVDLVFKK